MNDKKSTQLDEAGMVETEEFIFELDIKDVIWDSISGRRDEVERLELMEKYHEFYGRLMKEDELVTRGTILVCDKGEKSVHMDAVMDHGVLAPNGEALMTCEDCKNDNVPSFGKCLCGNPAIDEVLGIKRHPKVSENGEDYECVPVLGKRWMQKENRICLAKKNENADAEEKTYVGALLSGACLTCIYGGLITVVEIPEKKKKGDEKKEKKTKKKIVFDNDTADEMTRKKYIWDFLIKNLGVSEMHAAAILGNMQHESELYPTNAENKYGYEGNHNPEYIDKYEINDGVGWGLLQWTDESRKKGLLEHVQEKGTSVGDMDTQLEYLCYEVTEGGERNKFKNFLAMEDLEQATKYFCDKIERAGEKKYDKRIAFAKIAMEELSNKDK